MARTKLHERQRRRKIRERLIKQYNWRTRARLMRPYVEGLEAKDGYDLSKVDEWSPGKKARVTKLWRELGVQISRPHIRKSFKNKKRLAQAATYAAQEKVVPRQKAVAIPATTPRAVKITFDKKDNISVRWQGVKTDTVRFDKMALLVDPVAEIERVLDMLDGNFVQIIQGSNFSRDIIRKRDVVRHILRSMSRYSADDFDDDDPYSSYWFNWMSGLRSYDVKEKTIVEDVTDTYRDASQAARQAIDRIDKQRREFVNKRLVEYDKQVKKERKKKRKKKRKVKRKSKGKRK